jgi:HK97 family phage prohead protease
MEYKSVLTEHKFIDERTVEGIANVTGILDLGNDIVANRAFKKTLRERSEKVRHLWQHDFTLPPTATIVEMEEVEADALPKQITKKFPEATGGLRVVRRYLETDRGNEVLAGLKAGAVEEMSIGYDPIKVEFEEREQDNGIIVSVRILRELRLWDTSDVNWGMNPATVAAKSEIPLSDWRVAQLLENIELLREAIADKAINLPNPVCFLTKLDEAIAILTADPLRAAAVTETVLRRLALAERELENI